MDTFDCVWFVHLSSHKRNKLYAQSIRCAFIGYSIFHKGYVCYDSCFNRFSISRHMVFFENQYLFSTHVAFVLGILVFPCFDDFFSTPKQFMPRFVHEQRCLILSLHDLDSTFNLVQTMLFVIELDSILIPCHSLILLIGIDFLLYPFMLLFHLFQFLHVIPRQLSIMLARDHGR
ncbi:hypothetical protein NC653_006149 [Populus alba x Populus x berolinensis]|uniref:Retroviral polymerase SH3-like domain-containing protein n=1 Tax=Populus alba x Populus x berolinensis TaxID=444605 RepID=A0AAD6WDY8_9ROSI|nr:hypothetical protein NC653_006149 [Populus alba x Populus x berolinensis]